MSEYDKIADRATTGPCIACKQAAWIAKYVRHGAVLPTIGCTCAATLNPNAVPDLLAALERCLATMAVVSPEGAIAVLGAHDAIAKAREAK